MDGKWEKKLGISTCAAAFEKDDKNHSRYEPTSYAVLERLAKSGFIGRDDVLVDYGCGKGRVGFYMNYVLGCRCIGVECDEGLCLAARENAASYAGRRGGVEFVCANAEGWAVPPEANCFYFFNPFSAQILQSVLGRIREGWYENPREMKLFFYYTQDAYLDCLSQQDDLSFAGEIDCRNLFPGNNPMEKILVYKMNPAM